MDKKKRVEEKEKIEEIPRKKFYRMRAHCNVLSDTAFPLFDKKSTQSRLCKLEFTLS